MRLLVSATMVSAHHRILQNRRDNRLSNLILLAGSGSRGCHWQWHSRERAEAERLGYIVRHGLAADTARIPVYNNQPSLGRVGWHRLTDDGDLIHLDAPPEACAIDLTGEPSE